MRKICAAALLGLLAGAAPLFAQASPQSIELVTDWYRHFLGRSEDPGIVGWAQQLDAGQPPEKVLALILGSPEYYDRCGGTPRRFVGALFQDLTGRPPTREQAAVWLRRLALDPNGGESDDERVDVAYNVLLRYPQNYQVAPPPPPPVIIDRDHHDRDWDRRYWDHDDDHDYRRPYYPPIHRDQDHDHKDRR